jgi:peptide/nickel transport system ATP-binding protein
VSNHLAIRMEALERAVPEPPRLQVRDLEIATASGADVVAEVSFSISSGEVLGLVGESGSGKTTAALALLGYVRRGLHFVGGQVLIDGTDILDLSSTELREARGRSVAYVPQDPSAALNPALKVGMQLREALKVHRGIAGQVDVDARVGEMLSESSLDSSDLLGRYPHQLSGGQQQRVAIAMALACRPALIVLDEPTTGLDVTTQRNVLDTVRRLCNAHGVAAVYVSHDLAVVSGLVTNVAVMYAGRVIELGSRDAIFETPAHPYTRRLLAAIPSPERAEVLVGIEGQPPRPGQRPGGCSFASRCSNAIEICRQSMPVETTVAGRMVRCHRAVELKDQDRVSSAPLRPAEAGGADALIAVRGLEASYGSRKVLHGVNFELAPQSCLAIVGESGSGKTTLAQCLVGLHANWTGELMLAGMPLRGGIRERSRDSAKRVQYIFQNPYTSLNPRKTIGQIIAQPLENLTSLSYTARVDRVEEVLTDTSLGPDFMRRFPDELSGGERQRVAIARALAVEPDVLICDEVTSALDVSVQAVIVEMLRRLQTERQLAMIFITHNLALVRSIAQTVIVLNHGRVVEAGEVNEVMTHPKDPYTLRLVNDIPKLSDAQTVGDMRPRA